MIPDGMVMLASNHDPKETMDRLAAAVTRRGITVLARLDYAAAAAKVGTELRPTEILIFGNLKAGTPLMQAAPTIGIDLALRAPVWEDGEGMSWFAYNDPKWLGRRHGTDRETDGIVDAMTDGLAEIAVEAATQRANRSR